MAAAKPKSKAPTSPKTTAPASALLQHILGGLERVRGVFSLGPKVLAQFEKNLAALDRKLQPAAVNEIVRFARFLRTKHQSPEASEALLHSAERVVGALKASGWNTTKKR